MCLGSMTSDSADGSCSTTVVWSVGNEGYGVRLRSSDGSSSSRRTTKKVRTTLRSGVCVVYDNNTRALAVHRVPKRNRTTSSMIVSTVECAIAQSDLL